MLEWKNIVNEFHGQVLNKQKENPLKDFETPLQAIGYTKNGFVLSFYLLKYYKIYHEEQLYEN